MNPTLIAGLVALALGFASGWAVRAQRADRDIAQQAAKFDQERVKAALATKDAVEQARADERATVTKQSEVVNVAAKKQNVVAMAVPRRAADDQRLFDAARAAARADCAAPGPAAAASSPDASGPGTTVLADVFAEMGRAGRGMATQAELRGIALEACNGAYGALK